MMLSTDDKVVNITMNMLIMTVDTDPLDINCPVGLKPSPLLHPCEDPPRMIAACDPHDCLIEVGSPFIIFDLVTAFNKLTLNGKLSKGLGLFFKEFFAPKIQSFFGEKG